MEREQRNPAWSRQGFTLTELLLVIVVIGILLAITAPRIATAMARRNVTGATAGMEALLRRARASAIQTRLPATITFASGVATVTVDSAGTAKVVGQPLNFAAQYGGVAVTPSSATLRIEPTGLIVTGTPYTMIATKGSAADTTLITGYGRIE
ncbi:MAG: GspH/FimT family pseudopilin [Gemmatimonadota bacterium]